MQGDDAQKSKMHGSPPENSDKLPAAPRPKGYCDETQHGERDHHDMRPEDRLSHLSEERCVHFISVIIARYHPHVTPGSVQNYRQWVHLVAAVLRGGFIAVDAPKVGTDVQFILYRADDSVIGSFRSLWIVREDGDRWAVAVQSSFAG